MKRLIIIIPTDKAEPANQAMQEVLGKAGKGTFGSVKLSEDGSKPATHTACNIRLTDEQATQVENKLSSVGNVYEGSWDEAKAQEGVQSVGKEPKPPKPPKPEPTLEEKVGKLDRQNKALKKRITESTDYKDLKDKVSKVENSKDSPTKWSDKVELLEGEYIDHKGTIYVVLQDHTASKDNEPPQEDLYELV